MATIQEEVVVDAPLDVVYGQWTQFDEFPRFMQNVKEVRQLDDTRLFWRAEIGGKEHSWEAQIVEQVPNQVVSWRSTDGLITSGAVTFEPEGSGEATRVHVEMDYEPEGLTEKIGSALNVDDAYVQGDLGRFKELVEERMTPTGEWEGRVEGGRVANEGF